MPAHLPSTLSIPTANASPSDAIRESGRPSGKRPAQVDQRASSQPPLEMHSPIATPFSHRRAKLATLIVLLLAIVAACFPPLDRNQNFRLRKMNRAGWRIARGEDYSKVLTQAYPGYDIGTPLSLAVLMRLTMSPEQLASGPPAQAPPLYHLLHRAAFAIAVAALFAALYRLATPIVAISVAALMLLSPNWQFIAYSDDVYLFPMYALTAALAGIACLSSRNRFAWPAILLCSIAIGVACMFRNVSILCLAGVLAIAAFPTILFDACDRSRVRVRAIAMLVVAVLCGIAPGLIVNSRGHVFWHPLHCGLAEFGGHEDSDALLYPWFVPADDLPHDATPVHDWSDERSYRRARKAIPGVVTCSAEYDALMRSDYLDVWRRYPLGMIRTYVARCINVLSLNPAQSHTADSRIIGATADAFAFAALGTLIMLAWRTRLPRRAWFFAIAFAPMLAAPIIAHSGYIMYNAPARLPYYIFAAWTLQHLLRRRYRNTPPPSRDLAAM